MTGKRNDYPRLISFRLDEALYRKIKNGARNAGITGGEYIRKQLSSGKVVVVQEIIADVPQLKRLIAEFGRIGANLNQIARYYNSSGTASAEMRNRLNSSLSELYDMKYQVEQMGGALLGNTKAHTGKKQ